MPETLEDVWCSWSVTGSLSCAVVLQITRFSSSPSLTWRRVSTWGRSCSRWAGRTSCRTRWRATRARCVQRVDSLWPPVHHTLSQVQTSSSYMFAVCPSVLCSLVRWCGSSAPWRSPRPSSTWWSLPNASTASWICVRTIRSCCWKLVRGTDTVLTGFCQSGVSLIKLNCVCHSNTISRMHVSSARFCRTTDQIKLHVSLCWTVTFVLVESSLCLSSQRCADALLHTEHTEIKTATNNDGNVSRCRVLWRVLAVEINMNLDFVCLRCFERFTSSVWTSVEMNQKHTNILSIFKVEIWLPV